MIIKINILFDKRFTPITYGEITQNCRIISIFSV